MDIKLKLGRRIKELRLLSGLSQEKLSYKSKLHRTYISSLERGKLNISIENIQKIASALGVSIRDLFL